MEEFDPDYVPEDDAEKVNVVNKAKWGMGSTYIDSDDQSTPDDLFNALHKEFGFNFDPCPLGGHKLFDGLRIPWKTRNFCNPPWSDIKKWVIKAIQEATQGNLTVMLLPVRPSSNYWQDYVMPYATKIRFIKGKVCFGKYYAENRGVPAPVSIVIFDPLNKLQRTLTFNFMDRYPYYEWDIARLPKTEPVDYSNLPKPPRTVEDVLKLLATQKQRTTVEFKSAKPTSFYQLDKPQPITEQLFQLDDFNSLQTEQTYGYQSLVRDSYLSLPIDTNQQFTPTVNQQFQEQQPPVKRKRGRPPKQRT